MVALPELPHKGRQMLEGIINEFAPKVGLRGYRIWHYRTLCNLIDTTRSVRQAFAGFIAPDDILFRLKDYQLGMSSVLCDIIKREVAADLRADQWVRLSQTQGAVQDKLSLSTVGIDLPLTTGTVQAARYILDAENEYLDHSIQMAHCLI